MDSLTSRNTNRDSDSLYTTKNDIYIVLYVQYKFETVPSCTTYEFLRIVNYHLRRLLNLEYKAELAILEKTKKDLDLIRGDKKKQPDNRKQANHFHMQVWGLLSTAGLSLYFHSI